MALTGENPLCKAMSAIVKNPFSSASILPVLLLLNHILMWRNSHRVFEQTCRLTLTTLVQPVINLDQGEYEYSQWLAVIERELLLFSDVMICADLE